MSYIIKYVSVSTALLAQMIEHLEVLVVSRVV